MVTVIDYKQQKTQDGKEFFALILEGDMEFVKSKESGKFYATARKTSLTSTFSETQCKKLIGKVMPGTIEKIETAPYDYRIPESDEVIQLTHSYVYNPKETTEDVVFETAVR